MSRNLHLVTWKLKWKRSSYSRNLFQDKLTINIYTPRHGKGQCVCESHFLFGMSTCMPLELTLQVCQYSKSCICMCQGVLASICFYSLVTVWGKGSICVTGGGVRLWLSILAQGGQMSSEKSKCPWWPWSLGNALCLKVEVENWLFLIHRTFSFFINKVVSIKVSYMKKVSSVSCKATKEFTYCHGKKRKYTFFKL